MITTDKEYRKLFNKYAPLSHKVEKVFASCKTREQLGVAFNYSKLTRKKAIRNKSISEIGQYALIIDVELKYLGLL